MESTAPPRTRILSPPCDPTTRSRWRVVDGRASLYVASPEDTILAKLKWYQDGGAISDRQWNDVIGVLKVQGAILDQRYLRHWAGKLGLSDLLQRSFGDAALTSKD